MAALPERIEQLVERSSLGAPDARRARARVTDATAHAVLRKIASQQRSSARAVRSMRSTSSSRTAGTGKFGGRRGNGGS